MVYLDGHQVNLGLKPRKVNPSPGLLFFLIIPTTPPDHAQTQHEQAPGGYTGHYKGDSEDDGADHNSRNIIPSNQLKLAKKISPSMILRNLQCMSQCSFIFFPPQERITSNPLIINLEHAAVSAPEGPPVGPIDRRSGFRVLVAVAPVALDLVRVELALPVGIPDLPVVRGRFALEFICRSFSSCSAGS